MTVFRFALRRAFHDPLNLLLLCVLPLAAALLPAVEGWSLPIGFQMYGALLLFGAFMLLRSVVEDGASGVLERLGAAPLTHFRYLLETLLAYGVILLAQNVLVVLLGFLVHGAALPQPFLLVLAYSVFSVTALALNLAGGALFKNRETTYQALASVLLILSMVGGFFWPLEIAPPVLRRLAMATPCYWLLDAIACLKVHGSPGRFALALGIMLLFALAFLLAGSRRRMA